MVKVVYFMLRILYHKKNFLEVVEILKTQECLEVLPTQRALVTSVKQAQWMLEIEVRLLSFEE